MEGTKGRRVWRELMNVYAPLENKRKNRKAVSWLYVCPFISLMTFNFGI